MNDKNYWRWMRKNYWRWMIKIFHNIYCWWMILIIVDEWFKLLKMKYFWYYFATLISCYCYVSHLLLEHYLAIASHKLFYQLDKWIDSLTHWLCPIVQTHFLKIPHQNLCIKSLSLIHRIHIRHIDSMDTLQKLIDPLDPMECRCVKLLPIQQSKSHGFIETCPRDPETQPQSVRRWIIRDWITINLHNQIIDPGLCEPMIQEFSHIILVLLDLMDNRFLGIVYDFMIPWIHVD